MRWKRFTITALGVQKRYEEDNTEWINTRPLGEQCRLDKEVRERAREKVTFVWVPERPDRGSHLMGWAQGFRERVTDPQNIELKMSGLSEHKGSFLAAIHWAWRVRFEITQVFIGYTYLLLSKPLWVLWIPCPSISFCGSLKRCISYWTGPSKFTWIKS